MSKGRSASASRRRSRNLNKAISPNFAAMASSPGGRAVNEAAVTPIPFTLLDAINVATGQPTGQAHFQALPRDPFDEGAFGPLNPLRPDPIDAVGQDGLTAPRTWQYTVGWNLPGSGDREVPWQVLRGAASGVGIIRRCIEVRKKHVRDLDWTFSPTEQAIQDLYRKDPKLGKLDAEAQLREQLEPDIQRMRAFWEKPWRSNGVSFGQWVNAVLEDYMTMDAVAIYPQRSYGGDVLDLRLVDPSTIKVLLDTYGNRPIAPHPAFQQILYGFPRGEWTATGELDEDGNTIIENGYTSSELFYYRENFRTFSPYGFSPVEQALFDSRLYLKRQQWMIAEYDDGSTPLTWLETPVLEAGAQGLSLTQARQWMQALNSRTAGNTGERLRAKVLPNGWKAVQMDGIDERYRPEYDLFLIKLLCSYFGVPIAELGFTEPTGLGNQSWHEGQADVSGRLGKRPDTAVIADIVNAISREQLRMPAQMAFNFADQAAANDLESAQTDQIQINSATKTVNDARRARGESLWTFPEADMPFILAGPQGIIFLDGAKAALEAAAEQAAMAAEAQKLGTEGKLELEGAKLEDGKEARKEAQDLERETRDLTLEAASPDAKKMAELSAFRNWRRKLGTRTPARQFIFKSVEPGDGWPELNGLGPDLVWFEGYEWLEEGENLDKRAKPSGLNWVQWNAKNPTKMKDARGRWVKSGAFESLVDAIAGQDNSGGRVREPSGTVDPVNADEIQLQDGVVTRAQLNAHAGYLPLGAVPEPAARGDKVWTRRGAGIYLGPDKESDMGSVTYWVESAGDEHWGGMFHASSVSALNPAGDGPADGADDWRNGRMEVPFPHKSSAERQQADVAHQEQVDKAKGRAALLAELSGLLADDAPSDVISHRARARMRRHGLEDEPLLQSLAENVDAKGLEFVARELGFRQFSTAGELSTMDARDHMPFGAHIETGAPVRVMRPGFEFKVGDQRIQHKATVERDSTAKPDAPQGPAERIAELEAELGELAGKFDPVSRTLRRELKAEIDEIKIKRAKEAPREAPTGQSTDVLMENARQGIAAEKLGKLGTMQKEILRNIGNGQRVPEGTRGAKGMGNLLQLSEHRDYYELSDLGRAAFAQLYNLNKAAAPEPGDGGADPKAPAPVTAPPPDLRWPGWLMDMAIAGAAGAALVAAMRGLLTPTGLLAKALRETLGLFGRTRPGDPVPDFAEQLKLMPGVVEEVAQAIAPPIRAAHIEGGLTGERSAQALVDFVRQGDGQDAHSAVEFDIDWSGWTPGHPEAARLLLTPGGLERLLELSDVTIRRIAANRIDRLGQIIGNGLARGDAPEKVGRAVADEFGNESWAQMVALTETSRAQSAAAINQYREAGLQFKGWMTALDQRVCPRCFENEFNADGTPRVIPIEANFPSGDPWPPAHPRCRCAPIPVWRNPRSMTHDLTGNVR